MNSIGGYFELELRKGAEYHPNAIALNTGRNALELILRVKKYKKVFIPYYTCDVILEPINRTNTLYEFYSITPNFEPVFDYSLIKENEGFLYTNYFGLKDAFINKLAKECKNLIIDNSQSFFSLPINKVPTFYSCRKFFGVPDGAYLYLDGVSGNEFLHDHSENRFAHLLKRIELGAEAGYDDFKSIENSLIGQPIMQMSKLTQALLSNIDYAFVQKKRRENFLFLHDKLSKFNKIEIDIKKNFVPMVYPFLTKNLKLKQKLINKNVYVATYWPNVIDWTTNDTFEYKYTQQIIHLPIDQRYTLVNITEVIKIIKQVEKKWENLKNTRFI